MTEPFVGPLGVQPWTRDDGAPNGFVVRAWAPSATEVAIVVGDPDHPDDPARPLRAEAAGDGTWTCPISWLRHGQRYEVAVDGVRGPDPWSRWQPDGSAGRSAVVDPTVIGAVEPGTLGRPARPARTLADAVIYELHVGTFSASGDFPGVIEHLGGLADLGITHVELMPVNQFPGRHGWGYDGIFWSAAHHAYGGPARLVQLVDAAHEAGLGVLLDVVYNHIGPEGGELYDRFGPFFTDAHETPWGKGINVDGPGSAAVRETILQSAAWWVGSIGVDGLRVDACHAIVDTSPRHVLAELTDRVHAFHPRALLVAESGLNDPKVVRPEAAGGWAFDADWSDDFHHALRTLVTDDRQGWYADFGHVADLAKAFHRPLVHDGTWSAYRGRTFGAPAEDVAPEHFVVFDQDHDQVGNRPLGDRMPPEARPLAALCTLLSPYTPMLFMGEEHGEDAPFLYFSDHEDPFLADATRDGRRREFADFTAATGTEIPDPQDAATFQRSKLTWAGDPRLADLYRRLLALRPQIPRVGPGREAEVTFDEAAGWLRVDRGTSVLLANFARSPSRVPAPPGWVELATHRGTADRIDPADPHLLLPALGGALLWKDPTAP